MKAPRHWTERFAVGTRVRVNRSGWTGTVERVVDHGRQHPGSASVTVRWDANGVTGRVANPPMNLTVIKDEEQDQ